MIAEPAAMCHASDAILSKRVVQSLPRRVNTFSEHWPGELEPDSRRILFSCIQRAPFGDLSIKVAKAGSMKPGKRALMPTGDFDIRQAEEPTVALAAGALQRNL